jgi:dihydroneopterin aldolase
VTPSASTTCKVSIDDLRVAARVGCTTEERERLQTLSISVEVWFDHAVLGMKTDELNDTCCYASVSREVSELAKRLECNLIEYFASAVHACVSDVLARGSIRASLVEVQVRKVHPPVVHLRSAAFVYSAPPAI